MHHSYFNCESLFRRSTGTAVSFLKKKHISKTKANEDRHHYTKILLKSHSLYLPLFCNRNYRKKLVSLSKRRLLILSIMD